mmetsp:Transcript_24403/g.69983  ORF Transcript_24403/g.69983 Transcript_24403/m.69983 type:complete len:293 (-) Transcript_24403:314-1192(-)
MKLWLRASLLLLCSAQAEARRWNAGHHPEHKQHLALAEHRDTADDLFTCFNVSGEFVGENVDRADVVKKALNYCKNKADLPNRSFVCPHFKEGISRALELEPEEKLYNAKSFCEATEAYMINVRGASRVPRTGSGPLLGFTVSPECKQIVAAAFAPDETLATSSVPDFWYAMCINQDCAHFLPSRAKWCNIQREPTHSVVVCEAARKFALDEVTVHEAKAMNPEQICSLYSEFAEEMGIDVDAYEQVIHGKVTHEAGEARSHARGKANLQVFKALFFASLTMASVGALLASA